PSFFLLVLLRPLCSTLFPYTTLFRSCRRRARRLRRRRARCCLSLSYGRLSLLGAGARLLKAPACSSVCFRVLCSNTETDRRTGRSEEHTSELQSLAYLVCRLLLEKKN